MTSFLQPGVSFSDSLLTPTPYENATAVPVFIGYTQGGVKGGLYAIESFTDYQNQLKENHPAERSVLYYALQHYFDNNGGRCFVLCIDNYDALKEADDDKITADLSNTVLLSVIATEPEINLVAVPDIVLLDGDKVADSDKVNRWLQVWQALLQIQQEHFNLFCILDTPSSVNQTIKCKEQFVQLALGNAAYSAAYWPHLITDYYLDVEKGTERVKLPPSAAVIAAIQHTDRERGIWKAPANIPLSHVLKPEYSQWETEQLFSETTATINAIHSFPGRGVRIWGCRTLVDTPNQSVFRYVQIRRLVSYIETHLIQISRFFVFEPNNELTWIKLKGFARSWLRKLWQSGGLFGTQEEQAFQLFLGIGESMTQEDIKQGKMIMRIGVALLYPAEFIQIDLQLNTRENEVTTQVAHPSFSRRVLV